MKVTTLEDLDELPKGTILVSDEPNRRYNIQQIIQVGIKAKSYIVDGFFTPRHTMQEYLPATVIHQGKEQKMTPEELDKIEQRAERLVDEDFKLREALVRARCEAGLSQIDVAERAGISPESVAAFERYDSNPTLGTIRIYALVVGADIKHEVTTGKVVTK